ncbi:hypothetical protein ACFX13_014355 [Malus domestica]
MMGDPLGSSRMSSQKQNRESVVGAQSGQYRATVVERARDVVNPRLGCDNLYAIYCCYITILVALKVK